MSYSNTIRSRGARRNRVAGRRMTLLGIATILSLLVSLFPQIAGLPVSTASAHNLQTRMVYMFFDPDTQTMLDNRMANPLWTPPDPLLQTGDELGLIIKVVPRDGTTTGVGGHVDFYVPNGVTVLDAAYIIPNGTGGYDRTAMKGQSPIAIGAGPIGAKATTQLLNLTSTNCPPEGCTYTNINGVTTDPVVNASGLHRGTIAGVYGDTGIFYATDPDTAYGSWQAYTGDSTANGCGSLAFNPTALGKTIVNNSGDTDVPCNKWDAEQLMAWGAKGGTFGASAPIVDYGDGRGNAPWGFAAGTGGPQSGYAWNFNWDEWQTSAKDAAAMREAMSSNEIGPWQRIKYPGSRISYDQPGLTSTVLGYASVGADNVGVDLTTGDLPPTVSQTDGTSPKAIRWAVGQLTAYRPEYVWVKIRVDTAEIVNPSGCPNFQADTFGGDAGGTDNGKDHLWRYYEPTEVRLSECVASGKPAPQMIVKSGDVIQYPVKVYNLQNFALTGVVVKETLPSGVTLLSSVPSQNSGPNPLQWNVGTLLPGQKFSAVVSVKVTATGYLDNCMTVDTIELPDQTACDTTISGLYPYLVPTKSVTGSPLAPGGTVEYTILTKNIGTGATGSPVTVNEYLPTGFTYDNTFTPVVIVNGAAVPGTTVSTTSPNTPNTPTFSVPAAINGGSQMTIKFRATVSASTPAGDYCNSYRVTQNGIPITTGSQACVTVAGGQIGDTIYRDWNGNGLQDTGRRRHPRRDRAIERRRHRGDRRQRQVPLRGPDPRQLHRGCHQRHPGRLPAHDPAGAAESDAGAQPAESHRRLRLPAGGDRQHRRPGLRGQGQRWRLRPGLGDVGIPGITVNLYEDTNGNGVIDAGVDALVATDDHGCQRHLRLPQPGHRLQLHRGCGGRRHHQLLRSSNPWVATTADPRPVPNLSGAYLTADFGYFKLVPGAIGDQVFEDKNGNGTYEAGTDQPLANVTVSLYRDTNGNGVLDAGEPLLQTDSSDALGIYGFANLPAGDYIVVVDSADPDVPAGLSTVIGQYATNLTAGETDNTLDFPFAQLLQKSVSPTTPAVGGDTLSYTVNVNYPGTTALENVVVTDAVPAGTTYVGGSANAGGVLSVDGSQVIWSLGSGAPGVPGVTSPQGTALCYGTKTYAAAADTYIDFDKPTTNTGTDY